MRRMPAEPAEQDAKLGRSVVDGAFRVLRALAAADPAHQVAQIAQLTDLPRPTVHRLLRQLHEADAVAWSHGQWVLSTGLLGLARDVEPLPGLRTSAMPVLQLLREHTAAAVSLVVPDGDAYVALEMIPGRDALPLDARAGAAMPASTAAGIILAPGHDTAARRRPYGAAVDEEHILAGVTCYAVPVRLPRGRRAALQIATAADRPAERLAAAVHHAARALEHRAEEVSRSSPVR